MTNRTQVLQLYRLIRVLNPTLSTTRVLARMSEILPQWPIHEWGPCFGCEKTCCMPALCDVCEKACLSENIAAVCDAIASVPPPEPPVTVTHWLRSSFTCNGRSSGWVSEKKQEVTCPECLKAISEDADRHANSPESRLSLLETRVDAISQRMAQQDTMTRKYR